MDTKIETKFIDLQLEENNYQICESCGARMIEKECKIKCQRCGYFRSCSDLF